ncbi:hypothetical protein KKA50_01065, partial [Patescibacteria group bacterium]|nr:hypothetical protein [Patescibacteria group bacterium]
MKFSFSKIFEKIKKRPDIVFYVFLGFYFLFMIFISNFRDMIKDEALYYRETYLMSELIRNGIWFGDYGVGLHGFLFKLPPALIFLITGPSIDVVTIYNVILSIGVGFFFYRFVKLFLKNGWYAFFATVFLMTNFHFVISTPTYLREIPSLLIIIMFMWGVLKNWNKWYMSLVFVLLLDTKEYVFLVFVIVYVLWLFITCKEKRFFKKVWEVFKQCLIVFIPSLIWIVLMFFTSIIPVNMFLASTVGLVQDGLLYTIRHFQAGLTTLNLIDNGKTIKGVATDAVYASTVVGQEGSQHVSIFSSVIPTINLIISYIGKILYPRTFSFLSVTKVVIFPTLFASFWVLINYLKKKIKMEPIFVFSSLLYLIWIIFYILRASHGRYLLPIVPAISVMMIYTLFFSKFTKNQRLSVLMGTGLFMIAGFFFEESYLIEKVILETTLFAILCITFFKPKLRYWKYIFLTLVTSAAFGVAILFSYTQGQISGYINWGKNREVEQIVKALPQGDLYWINIADNLNVLAVLNDETNSAVEWKWSLSDDIKEAKDMKTFGSSYGYGLSIVDLPSFRVSLREHGIKHIVFVKSTIQGEAFAQQEWLADFLTRKWLKLTDTIPLQGKIIYTFDVVE